MFSWFGRKERGQAELGFQHPTANSTDDERENDELIATRKILLRQEIDDASATKAIAKMLFLQHLDRQKDISIDIESHGGSVSAGFAICDTIDFISCPVATHCSTHAGGMAALLLAAGAKGRRSMSSRASVAFVPPVAHRGTNDELVRTYELLTRKFAELTRQSPDRIRADMETYRNFVAIEAQVYGFVDIVQGDADYTSSKSTASPFQ